MVTVYFPEIISPPKDITLEAFNFFISFYLKNSEKDQYFPHFTSEKTEAQEDWQTYSTANLTSPLAHILVSHTQHVQIST